jgi:F-type H+-transporting ATPase subunit b
MNWIPFAQGFGLNTNILETNIINLGIVIGVLIYFGGDVLGAVLQKRSETIRNRRIDLDTLIGKLENEAKYARIKYRVARMKSNEMRLRNLLSQKDRAIFLIDRTYEDIQRLEASQERTIQLEQDKICRDFCFECSQLALQRATKKVEQKLSKDSSLGSTILDNNIRILGRL